MKRLVPLALFMLILSGCTFSLAQKPTSLPTLSIPTSAPASQTTPTVMMTIPTLAMTPQTVSTQPVATIATPLAPSATPASGVNTGSASGPYAVILIEDDVLNIRSGAGVTNSVIGTLNATARNIQQTGASAQVGEDRWVEINNPSGGKGWVNAKFLTEQIDPAAFCADAQAKALIDQLKQAMVDENGDLFATLVSPAHGLDLSMHHGSTIANYSSAEASWVFQSEYKVNWGAGASGIDDVKTFREYPLRNLRDVLNSNYEVKCNDDSAASMYVNPWLPRYKNINYFAVYKPGTPGVELDWRIWLAGVEYVKGKPYLFALLHFEWEP